MKRSNDDVSVRHELDAAPTGGRLHPIMVRWKMRGMKEDSPMATYHVIRGQVLARVPGIDPADIPSLLRMLVSESRGPQWRACPRSGMRWRD